jgi:signal peptidase
MDSHAIVVRRLPVLALPASPVSATLARPAVRSKRSRLSRRASRVALNLAFMATIACVAMMLGPAMLGVHRYVILTGSMTGTYDRGSIVFDRPVPVSELKVGDPITYAPPSGFTSQARVTHRIWSIHRGVDGERIFKTKGDANKHPDVWTFTLNQATQDRVLFHIPEVGYLFLLLSLRDFRIVLVGVPSLIIGLILVRQLWREGGEEARRQRLAGLGWRALRDPESTAALLPVRDRPPAGSARLRTAGRSRVDLSLPLRVGRLTSATAAQAYPDTRRSSFEHGQPARGASIATTRLVVSGGHTERRRRAAELSSPPPSAPG